MKIDKSAYASLELAKVLEIIRKDCRSDLGASRLAALEPASDMEELKRRHTLFTAIEEYRDRYGDFPWNFKLSSVGELLADAKESGMLTGEELLRFARLMQGAFRLKEALSEARGEWPVFSILLRDLHDFTAEIEALSVIDDDGRLYDHASDRLRRIRENSRRVSDQIRRKGQRLIGTPGIGNMLQERVLSLRNGRFVVMVRQDSLSAFPGLVIDRSGSGSSVYMEPHELLPLNNEHAILSQDEDTEERRILYKLTERMLAREGRLLDAERALGSIDLFYALSEKMRRDHWRMPILIANRAFRLHRATHPLLGKTAVPIDISCGMNFRSLVVTGPNTGGKTVALKTAGVCVCLGWLGFPIPAEEDSELGMTDSVYSDIGDEQSIEQNLSTFSAHMTQIKHILNEAGEGSLVLLDELGAGTSPDEGAALGIAILEWLGRRRSLVLATTHHNPIKHYALTAPNVESASVEFNAATLSPTYRLLIGIPGRSNALLIAEKLGMPEEILERAREALHGKETSMEDIIGELQEKRTAIEQESAELEARRAEIESMRAIYERQKREIEEKRDRLIAEADKKALGILENAENSARSLIKSIDAEARSAAQRKMEKTKKHFDKIESQVAKRDDERLQRLHVPDETPLAPGDTVVVIGTGAIGTLEEVRRDKATVTAGAARMELPLNMLRRAARDEEKRAGKRTKPGARAAESSGLQVRVSSPPAPVGVPSSIMLRGMTLDEAMPIVEQYLDRAFRAGYGEVTVIHGRGEGILRREVHILCRKLPYVTGCRLGAEGEGGYGVTIVSFRQ